MFANLRFTLKANFSQHTKFILALIPVLTVLKMLINTGKEFYWNMYKTQINNLNYVPLSLIERKLIIGKN